MLRKEIERIWSLIADLAEAETSDEDEEMEEDTTIPKGAGAKGASSSDESGGGPKPFEPKVEVKAEAGLTTKSHFLFPFCENSLICLEGKQINDPSSGKHCSLPFLPATPSSPSRTHEGLFELTRRPSRALDSPRALLQELQRYKDTVGWAALGTQLS